MATTSWLFVIFGEYQAMAQLIVKRVLIAPLINKDFPVRRPLFARGNFASVNLNHQKSRRPKFLYLSPGVSRRCRNTCTERTIAGVINKNALPRWGGPPVLAARWLGKEVVALPPPYPTT